MRNVLQAQPAVFVLAAHPEGHVGAEEVVKNFSDHADHMHAHNYFIQVPLSCIDESKRTSTVYVHKDNSFHEFDGQFAS